MRYCILAIIFLSGCTDAVMGYWSYGESQTVECYSGGKIIFSAKTTGKVFTLEGGGWAFQTPDGRYVQTFADCFVLCQQ